MRASPGRRVEYPIETAARGMRVQWLQAGFTGFAYRLAHLTLHRPVVLLSIASLFYLS
jgi:hypothetical protein